MYLIYWNTVISDPPNFAHAQDLQGSQVAVTEAEQGMLPAAPVLAAPEVQATPGVLDVAAAPTKPVVFFAGGAVVTLRAPTTPDRHCV